MDKAAPGLNSWSKRLTLLRKWQRQGRGCAYCPGQAETVDHVIPLVRGGTNREGNLAPCCTSCNVRKSDRLLIEWRLIKRVSIARASVVVPPKAERKAKPIEGVELALKLCVRCNALHFRIGVHCSAECVRDANREAMRNRYRERVGIPVDAPLWTRVA